MPKCVYIADDISFPCIMEIIHDVREGNISTTLVRKVLKQLDSALDKFDPVQESFTFSSGMGQDKRLDLLCNELETINTNSKEQADAGALSMNIGTRVAQLLKALLWELL